MTVRGEDLFRPVVAEERLSHSFRAVNERTSFLPAKRLMQDVFSSFPDTDGNFVEQFQTTGFDARTWELFLYAYLRESGFAIQRPRPAPDFLATREGLTVAIEAVTANASQGSSQSPPPLPSSPEDLEAFHSWLAIRLGSALYSKLERRYWELPQVGNRPLVLAIENFSYELSLFASDAALSTYLYGTNHDWRIRPDGTLEITPHPVGAHALGKKVIPSGFFHLPDAEHVSAILFANSGTVGKFNRMGHQSAYRQQGLVLVRMGTLYDHSPNATEPIRFAYQVGDPKWIESWGQGLSVFHNPKALKPIPRCWFPDAADHVGDDSGMLFSIIPPVHPIASFTQGFLQRARTGPPPEGPSGVTHA